MALFVGFTAMTVTNVLSASQVLSSLLANWRVPQGVRTLQPALKQRSETRAPGR